MLRKKKKTRVEKKTDELTDESHREKKNTETNPHDVIIKSTAFSIAFFIDTLFIRNRVTENDVGLLHCFIRNIL